MSRKFSFALRLLQESFIAFLYLGCLGVFILTGCDSVGESKASSRPPEPNSKIDGSNQKITQEDKVISFKGVNFRFDSNLVSGIEVEDVAEYIPKDPTFLPDTFEPRHFNFRFKDGAFRTVREGDFANEINVYSVQQYLHSARRTGKHSKGFDESFQNLQKVLSVDETGVGNDYPFVPWIDATPVIHAHKRFISFKNGTGVAYLTQFNIGDPILINNSKLIYVFQGLTADKKWFISATFHIRTSYLPDNQDATTYKTYKQPDDYYAPEHREQNIQEYKQYLLDVQTELENTNDGDFQPSLTLINEVLGSMEVKPRIFAN